AAIIELPGLLKRLPDGRQTAAALIIRAARTVLRIQQLDPLHGFFHSSLYRIPLTAYIGKQVAGWLPDISADAVAAITQHAAQHLDIGKLARCRPHSGSSGTINVAIQIRRREIEKYAPLLIALARRRLASEMGMDPDIET